MVESPTERRAYVGLASGKISYFEETSAKGKLMLSDNNGDGKVDEVSESLSRVPGFVVEGYDPAFEAERTYNRVLTDTNHDGSYDTESVTGDWFSAS